MKTVKFNIRIHPNYNSYLMYDGGYLKLLKDPNDNISSNLYCDQIHSCRETFMSTILRPLLKEENDYYFGVINKNNPKINQYRLYIKAIEKIMGLKGTIRAFPTDRKEVFVVKVTSWWLKSKIRQEALTILLRTWSKFHVANKSVKLNFKNLPIRDILLSHEYFQRTRPAVERFFFQNATLLKNKAGCDGWLSNFKDNHKDPNVVLVKLKRQKRHAEKGSAEYKSLKQNQNKSKPVALSTDDPNFSGASTM